MSDYILSLSYGKDSMACLGALGALGWPLTRIVTADVWATDTIPADLPPMVEFKKKADAIIKERYGIEVEHIFSEKNTYEKLFYTKRLKNENKIYGWPTGSLKGAYCSGMLKQNILKKIQKGSFVYIGIAADEPNRFHNLNGTTKSPLVEASWTEKMCYEWCDNNNLLSPIYTTSTRGGCWFCHNQSVNQLRILRRNYPEYWALMLKWDKESPVTFHSDGHTVHDFERRFQAEDDGFISSDDKLFRWSMLEGELNYRLF